MHIYNQQSQNDRNDTKDVDKCIHNCQFMYFFPFCFRYKERGISSHEFSFRHGSSGKA